jgi:S-adenosylmethionine:tRNA ribosyltransferase-isomerase
MNALAPDALLPAAALPREERDDVGLVVLERREASIDVRDFAELPAILRPGDLVVVNDAATWPASLRGRTASGEAIELRLVTGAFSPGDVVDAVAFGAGDWRTRTEDRPAPPPLQAGETITIDRGPTVQIARVHAPRKLAIAIPRDDAAFAQLLRAGRPVQYAHVAAPLAPWDVWTVYAGRPWAVEMPSAGRPLTHACLAALKARQISVVSLTEGAGLSSTGDPDLDRTLPWPERYDVPLATVAAVVGARARNARVIAVGTTVVRALETVARTGRAAGITDLVLDAAHRLRWVDGILSGLHDPHESHFRLLEAFAPRALLVAAWRRARDAGLHSHELGDSLLVL